ncbi:putative transmembrane protein, partial [Toxoplasma gondii RUB]
HFLPAEKLEAFEFGASLLSLSRFYLGDLCLLFFLAYAVCAFGSASLPLALLLLHFVKILLQTLLFILKSDASLWELWCYDLE